MKISWIILFIGLSFHSFAGLSKKEQKNLPSVELNTGQINQVEKYIKRKDPKLETDYIKVEFLCRKKLKRKSPYEDNYTCLLESVN